MKRLRSVSFVILLITAGACSDDARPSSLTFTDSADVEFVRVAWEAVAERWTIDSLPELVVGTGPIAGEEILLADVRDAILLEDGTLVVADGSTEQLIWVGPRGREVRRWGGRGDGPDEFGGTGGPMAAPGLLEVFRLPTANVGAFDQARIRAVEVIGDLGIVETHDLRPLLQGGVVDVAPGPAGELYLVRPTGESVSSGDGIRRPRVHVTLLRSLGGSDTIGIRGMLGPEGVSRPDYMGVLLFGAHSELSASGEGVWLGDTGARRVELWQPSGELARVVEWTSERSREVNPERVSEIRDLVGDQLGGGNQEAIEQMFATIPQAEELPAFQALLTGPRDQLWIGAFANALSLLPLPQPAQEWLIIDFRAREAGRVTAPAGLRVLQVGEDFVLGIHRDPLGVETVRKYTLRSH